MTTEKERALERIYNQLVDAIIEYNKEWMDKEKLGLDHYYLDRDNLILETIAQFEYPKKFMEKQFDDIIGLMVHIKDKFRLYIHNLEAEDELYDIWFKGGTISLNPDGWCRVLTIRLETTYRKRVTTTYNCAKCDKEISFKHHYGHPASMLKIGTPVNRIVTVDGVAQHLYEHNTYCFKCHANAPKGQFV